MSFLQVSSRRRFFVLSALLTVLAAGSFVVLRLKATQSSAGEKPSTAADKGISPEALRLNTLGVAFLNQQKGGRKRKSILRRLSL